MVRMLFVALDEYFSKENIWSTPVDQIVDFLDLCKKYGKKWPFFVSMVNGRGTFAICVMRR